MGEYKNVGATSGFRSVLGERGGVPSKTSQSLGERGVRDPPSTLSENISPSTKGCACFWWTTIVGGYIGGRDPKGRPKKVQRQKHNTRASGGRPGPTVGYRGLIGGRVRAPAYQAL